MSVPRVVLASLLHRSGVIIPLVGASRPATILDSVGATDLMLDGEDQRELDAAVNQSRSLPR